ncbi:MAG: phosphoglucomutase, alpha-D-glucose phosphate-specific, partial [Deltaproteobacteria bacterium]|nr:phosphoglucomutase, alpha-D-glucose phosphate-specific [Deltaproteobacteria bacterium]
PLSEKAKKKLASLDPAALVGRKLAGKTIAAAIDKAPGNGAAVGGLKVTLDDGSWFAVRPSGTEPKIKLYVESLSGPDFKDELVKNAGPFVWGED